MKGYSKILFPLDFSRTAPAVAEHVALMVENFGSELHVIHVVPSYEHHAFASFSQVMHEIKEQALKEIDKFVSQHLPDVKAVNQVVSGHTGRRIVSYAQEHGISLIIMGTHGRTELGSLVFGSVAQRVVHSSTVPVMSINPDADEAENPEAEE